MSVGPVARSCSSPRLRTPSKVGPSNTGLRTPRVTSEWSSGGRGTDSITVRCRIIPVVVPFQSTG